jgi:hypothetical protein
MSFFGQRLFDIVKAAPIEAWVAFGLGVVVIALGAWMIRRRRIRARDADPRRDRSPA